MKKQLLGFLKLLNLIYIQAVPVSGAVTIDYVTVGNPGNSADPATASLFSGSHFGAVDYEYRIGKHEVTNTQYAEFLNAKGASNSKGIFNSSMMSFGITQTGNSGSFSYSVTSGFENKPVVYVSWFDAARFTNWLGNGQGSGDMETGAYTLNGALNGIITVNPSAAVYLPSEDEWYKAAYYNGMTSTYSIYATGNDTITPADANYNLTGLNSSSNVGSYPDTNFYGTFDQSGNVWEWNDAVVTASTRGIRGGAWPTDYDVLQSSYRNHYDSSLESFGIGFRVAAIPEPTTFILAVLASGVLLIRRKRDHQTSATCHLINHTTSKRFTVK